MYKIYVSNPEIDLPTSISEQDERMGSYHFYPQVPIKISQKKQAKTEGSLGVGSVMAGTAIACVNC